MKYTMDTVKTWDESMQELKVAFQRWGRQQGATIPWQVLNQRGTRPVTLRYTLPGQPEVNLRVTEHRRDVDNLRVLVLTVDSLRLNDLRGISGLVREAYLALPAPAESADPYEVLGVRPDAPPEALQGAYRALVRVYHPDSGSRPDTAMMAALNAAWERIQQQGVKP